MADEKSIFQIEVVGIAEFDGFLKKLQIAKNSLIDIDKQYRMVEAQFKASNQAMSSEQNRFLAEKEARADISRKNRQQKEQLGMQKDLNDAKIANQTLIAQEKALTEAVRRENLTRTNSVKNFNGSLRLGLESTPQEIL